MQLVASLAFARAQYLAADVSAWCRLLSRLAAAVGGAPLELTGADAQTLGRYLLDDERSPELRRVLFERWEPVLALFERAAFWYGHECLRLGRQTPESCEAETILAYTSTIRYWQRTRGAV